MRTLATKVDGAVKAVLGPRQATPDSPHCMVAPRFYGLAADPRTPSKIIVRVQLMSLDPRSSQRCSCSSPC